MPNSLIRRTAFPMIDIIPASPAIAAFDLSDQRTWEKADLHRSFLDPIRAVRAHYDFVVFDCPPRLSLASFSALVASDHVIVPLEAADWGAQGITQVTEAVEYVRDRFNPNLNLLGYLVSRFSGNPGGGKKRMIGRRSLAVLHRPFQKFPQLIDGLAQDSDFPGKRTDGRGQLIEAALVAFARRRIKNGGSFLAGHKRLVSSFRRRNIDGVFLPRPTVQPIGGPDTHGPVFVTEQLVQLADGLEMFRLKVRTHGDEELRIVPQDDEVETADVGRNCGRRAFHLVDGGKRQAAVVHP